LEVARLQRGISWFEAKQAILREAIRHYLASPSLILHSTA
nr:IS701 family transposase [Rhodothermus marinus]MBO2493177.1 IS701 family transposase [Rhodothermus marinus]